MVAALASAVLLLLVAVALLARRVQREREERRRRAQRGPWPVRTVGLEEFAPVFRPGPHGPTLATEVAFVGHGPIHVPGGTSDAEAWVLAVLARGARLLFEFGTCTGKTAYLWARNSPPDARVVTLTLRPDDRAAYRTAAGDDGSDEAHALEESAFTEFLYSGTPAAAKIEQLYGDSKAFDPAPYAGRCDVVFVDGSHAYSYVMSDAEKALRLVRPGGVVLWHDYGAPREVPGVWRALNELSARLPLVHLRGTSFVAYRHPGPPAAEPAAPAG